MDRLKTAFNILDVLIAILRIINRSSSMIGFLNLCSVY